MKSIPLPVRVAAGLAATAVEQARTLPAKLAGLPVTVVSQALQVSMRVQQQVTELAIRGDEVLSGLRPVEETPEWATFDEDLEADAPARSSAFDRVADEAPADEAPEADFPEPEAPADVTELAEVTDIAGRGNGFAGVDPWAQEEHALAEEAGARELSFVTAENYDHLSLPQLRARLRRFTVEELIELLEYERTHANRPSFVGMLTRRIATVRDSGE